MVHVPAGTFQMGSPAGVGVFDEHPQHAVTLSGYCIDKTEVTVKAYGECVTAKGCMAPRLTVKMPIPVGMEEEKKLNRYCNGVDRGDHPMNCVDWAEAAAYCQWAGKRLPTEAEWEYAARHDPKTGENREYPWGNEKPNEKRLNACGLECTAMVARDLQANWTAMYKASDGWGSTAPVGSYPAGASPVGALDMAGNVYEWTSDWYGAYTESVPPNPQGPKTGDRRVVRGGDWSRLDAAFVRTAERHRLEPVNRIYGLGFRCVRGD
jgi:formylglycine-generating enzyme required for sulfatase activity